MKKTSPMSNIKKMLRWFCLVALLVGSILSKTKLTDQVYILLLLTWFQVFFLFDFFN